METIDLYQIHWPNPDDEIEEGWEALARLREQGKLRWIGVSNFNVEQMKRAQKIAPITSLQPPYSMLRRAIEAEILPFAQANGIGVINYSPMLSGLLTGKMTAERVAVTAAGRLAPQERGIQRAASEPQSAPGGIAARDRQRARRDSRRGGRGVDAAHPAITAAIVGGRSAMQVEETAAALSFRLERGRIRKRSAEFLATMQA